MHRKLAGVICAGIFCALACFSHSEERDFTALLTDMQSNVEIRLSGDKNWQKPETGLVLQQYDLIRTGPKSSAEITVNGEGIFSLEENSRYKVGELKNKKQWFELLSGAVLFKIGNLLHPEEELSILSNNAVAAVRGTEAAIEINDDPATTHIGLFEGNMAVSSLALPEAQSIILHEGFQTHIGKNKAFAQPYQLKKRMLKHKMKMKKIRARLAAVRINWHALNKKRTQKIRRKLRRRTRKKKP